MQHTKGIIAAIACAALVCGVQLISGCGGQSQDTKEHAVTSQKDVPPGKNRLALEKSPYLLQHADNPVDWYPWGEEAFARARAEDKPIFLSIGYSTCHWCHVMEHESFEDSTVAALMNEAFVNVKVDREERPDIDNIYMTLCQMFTGRGGWPLTIIMTPDGEAFFAATYVPKEGRYGSAGMMDLIPQVVDYWANKRPELLASANQATENLRAFTNKAAATETLGSGVLGDAYTNFKARFDSQFGGFGDAPKFPTPHNLLFLLRYWKRSGDEQALFMVEKTLDEMARGGIYDHVGFGFHRYSTDQKWFAPHFEKMLYDQALLVITYTETYLATGNRDYRRTAEEIMSYVLRDMTDSRGGFYSAEDADSEGIEGKFYLWTEADVRALLDKDDAELVIDVYGMTEQGNFHEDIAGANIPHLQKPLDAVAGERGVTEEELRERLGKIRARMFEAREQRIHPHKDDKVLTDWNGLMIAAAAIAGRALDEPRYTKAAKDAAAFVLDELREDNGRLLHRYRDGEAAIAGNVDDYAFLTWGLLELYQTTFDIDYLVTALELEKDLYERFWDAEHGGYFFTPSDGEELLVRTKEVYDGAVPSGNSVAMLNLTRLGRITASTALEQRADEIGRAFYNDVTKAPHAFTALLMALDFGVGPSYEVVIVGTADANDTKDMQRALDQVYVPNKVVVLKPSRGGDDIGKLASYTKTQSAIEGRATAYVCMNYACDLPTTDVGKMLELLGADTN